MANEFSSNDRLFDSFVLGNASLERVAYKNSISQPAWLNIAGPWQYRRHVSMSRLALPQGWLTRPG